LKLPKEIRFLILLKCDYQTLTQFSKTSKRMREELFEDGLFWRMKTERDFKILFPNRNMSADIWRNAYVKLFRKSERELVSNIRKRNADIVRNALLVGVHPNILGYGVPLLEMAVVGNCDLIALSIRLGVNPNTINQIGETALMKACEYNKIKVAELLLDLGADPNIQDDYGETALMRASKRGSILILNLLLKRGAKPNTQNRAGRTALAVACLQNYFKIVRPLINYGADINIRDDRGLTPLMWSCIVGGYKTVKMLLEEDALIVADPSGYTALMFAAEEGYLDIVKLLISFGSSVNATDVNHKTALDKAINRDQYDIIEYLFLEGGKVGSEL